MQVKRKILTTLIICSIGFFLVYMSSLDSAERKNLLAQLSSELVNETKESNKEDNEKKANTINSKEKDKLTSDLEKDKKGEFFPLKNLEKEIKEKKNLFKEKSSNSYTDVKEGFLQEANSIEGKIKTEADDFSSTLNRKLEEAILKEVCKNVATD